MKYNNKYNVISECSVAGCLLAVAGKKLNKKEKQALVFLSGREGKNATSTVKDLSVSLGCAESTSWSILNSLREMKLITYEKESLLVVLSGESKVLVRGGLS